MDKAIPGKTFFPLYPWAALPMWVGAEAVALCSGKLFFEMNSAYGIAVFAPSMLRGRLRGKRGAAYFGAFSAYRFFCYLTTQGRILECLAVGMGMALALFDRRGVGL